jgi:hypothetical protein
MRYLILLTIAVVFMFGTVQAGEVCTDAGDMAMIFMFDGFDNLSFDSFYGGLGLRYYLGDELALRPAVYFSKYNYKLESDTEGMTDDEYSLTDIGLELAFENHFRGPAPAVSPYWGAGGYFEWMTAVDDPSVPTGETGKTTDKGTALGLFGMLGFEWGFTDGLTLGGEYRLGFERFSGETEIDAARDETVGQYSDSWIGFGTASVFLSVYF